MRKLLILAVLLPLAGFGHDTNDAWHWHGKRVDSPTFTDGFGYELNEHTYYFNFTVYLDFKIPDGFDLRDHFKYRDQTFFIDSHNQWVKSLAIKTRPPFTHEDAWAIRCKAKELVEGKCKNHDRWSNAYCVECCRKQNFNFCPDCGEKLK